MPTIDLERFTKQMLLLSTAHLTKEDIARLSRMTIDTEVDGLQKHIWMVTDLGCADATPIKGGWILELKQEDHFPSSCAKEEGMSDHFVYLIDYCRQKDIDVIQLHRWADTASELPTFE